MKPNVLIVVLDAVRAQNLPFYGYHRDTTPFLSSLRSDLVVYQNAISASYWTMPSIASLFTGMYASSHGLLTDGEKINESLHTLPKVFKLQGYRTAGFVRNIYVSDYSGLNHGFDEFVTEYGWDRVKRIANIFSKKLVSSLQPPGVTRAAGADTHSPRDFQKNKLMDVVARCFDVLIDRGSGKFVQDFAKWLNQNRGTPFFTYLHIFETHSPYRAPWRFALRYLSVKENYRKLFINHDHLSYLLGKCRMTPEHFRILQSAYDNSISYADHIINRIFRLLEKNGVLDDTMVVMLADHGDNIGEHDLMFHYFCLYDTLIKVPLLIKYPKNIRLGGEVADIVQNVDIYPTVLSLLGVKDKGVWQQAEGNDLLGVAAPRRERDLAISELVKVFGPDRNKFKHELERYNRRLVSLRTRDRKFIYSSRGDHECYDLRNDPGEKNNNYGYNTGFSDLASKAVGHYEKMNNFYLANQPKIDGESDMTQVDASVAEQLKSLGYM